MKPLRPFSFVTTVPTDSSLQTPKETDAWPSLPIPIARPQNLAHPGVAGFIGSNLLEALLKLDEIPIGLHSFSTGHQQNLDELQQLVSPAQWRGFTYREIGV